MTNDEMVRRTYDMVLLMHQGFEAMKVEILAQAHRIAKLENKVEDTGKHDLAKLERALEKREENERERSTWWTRHWVAVVLAVSVVLLSTGCSVAGTLVLRKVFGV